MSSRPLVVEFCGLPGSGKSSVAAHTCRALRSAGVEAYVADLAVSAAAARPARVVRRAGLALRQAVRGPSDAAQVARLVAATGQSPRDGAALLAQLLAVQRLVARARRRNGVALLEEGLVQTLWSVALRSRVDCADELDRWLATTASPDLVVLVPGPSSLARRLPRRRGPAGGGRELGDGRRLLDRLLPRDALTVRTDGTVPLADLGRAAAEVVLRVV